MKPSRGEIQLRESVVADLHAFGVAPPIQLGFDGQAGPRGRVADEIHDDLVADQRTTAPILRDVAEHPVLDLVPLAGPGREVAHVDPQSGLAGELLEAYLPEPGPIPVASPTVGHDQKFRDRRIRSTAHPPPPLPDGSNSKRRRVVVDAHADPAFVRKDIVDAIGDRLAKLLVLEVMDAYSLWASLRSPLAATIGNIFSVSALGQEAMATMDLQVVVSDRTIGSPGIVGSFYNHAIFNCGGTDKEKDELGLRKVRHVIFNQ